jgi:hypothetical protein
MMKLEDKKYIETTRGESVRRRESIRYFSERISFHFRERD